MVRVFWLVEAELEFAKLPAAEQLAMIHAVEKLEAIGLSLRFPHTSGIQGTDGLRELRPRGGRSPWRMVYEFSGKDILLLAVAPEARSNNRAFNRALRLAHERQTQVEE